MIDGWISTKDRLPQKDGLYIIFNDGCVSGAWYEKGRRGSEWTDDYEGYCDFEPTHWAEMPEPPKEAENEAD